MPNKELRLSLRYRLIFYLGGSIFATVSYIAGLWAYGAESASWGDVQLSQALLRDLTAKFNSHLLTFIGWEIICTVFAVGIGYLFDKEVYYRRKAEEKANVDGLTDTYNHRYFQDRLNSEMERASRYERPLSLIMLDLDNFKAFNDTWGHQEGDKLLKWFADTCNKCIRGIDILARYGGEEFVVILPETSTEEAIAVADRIRQTTQDQSSMVFSKSKETTVSAGVASFPLHATTRHALVLNADVALYYAKLQGRNRCVVYEEKCHKTYRTKPELVKTLLSDDDMGAIEALGAVVDAREPHSKGHSVSVMRMAVMLAETMGLCAEETNNLRAAALLHDLGKIGTPEEVLGKVEPLQGDEWQQIENHAGLGSSILKRVQQMGNSISIGVKHHHERYDGKGYPNGLTGKNIPLFARIIAIADAFDAMTNARSYRQALTADEALEELRRCSGTQFDPELVEMFIDHVLREQQEAA